MWRKGKMKRRVLIFDTTLRDGEQSPGFSMNIHNKIRVARQLQLLGVDVIEAGFPIASSGDFEAVSLISKELKNVTVAGLCRANRKDIKCTWDALKSAQRPRIHTFIATSDIHIKYKLKSNRMDVLKAVEDSVKYARQFVEDVEFSAEDASRSDIGFLIEVIDCAVSSGASTVNLPDTVGYATPEEYGMLFRKVRRRFPENQVKLSAHTHNDLGLAVANSLAAIENGADQIECTINGIGERAGNASLEEIVMALVTRSSFYQTSFSINTRMLYPASKLLSEITSVPVPPNKAIVGDNAFAHEAGIHQDGVLKNPLTYEIMTPQSVGVEKRKLVLGKHSGRHALSERCKELGVELTAEELNVLYQNVMAIADKSGSVSDSDLKTAVEKLKVTSGNPIT